MYECAGNDDPETFRNPTNSGDKSKYEPLLFQRPGSDLSLKVSESEISNQHILNEYLQQLHTSKKTNTPLPLPAHSPTTSDSVGLVFGPNRSQFIVQAWTFLCKEVSLIT